MARNNFRASFFPVLFCSAYTVGKIRVVVSAGQSAQTVEESTLVLQSAKLSTGFHKTEAP
jgi:hypothetical protein